MAMYYYASRLSSIACGNRCRHSKSMQKNRSNHCGGNNVTGQQREQKSGHKSKSSSNRHHDNDDDDDDNNNDNDEDNDIKLVVDQMAQTSIKSTKMVTYGDNQIILGTSTELPEFSCENAAPPSIASMNATLGSGGIMYHSSNIISGPLESLIDILMPNNIEDFDKEYIFSFLLSSRLFIRPHELLGKILSSVPETESLDRLVCLLGIWTKTFPYDYRDERIMCHVKHIVAKCANTGLGDVVSKLLSALLNRLTELEKHEKELRACQTLTDCETIKWSSSTQLAQRLCRIERKFAKQIGPEEFVQCSNTILFNKHSKRCDINNMTGNTSTVIQDAKKTCNLESYLDWSARLRLLVANDVLMCNGIRERSKTVEQWSGAAQYCLLVGNYNSAKSILESLESPAISRLQTTWKKLSSTSQQLDCMQRHAEGCGELWNKQTGNSSSAGGSNNNIDAIKKSTSFSSSSIGDRYKPESSADATNNSSNSDWVVIPVFSDIVRLAIAGREECFQKLPNGHVNVEAFDRLAAVVRAFTKHMTEVNSTMADEHEYQEFCGNMQNCTLHNEKELMLASFDCEGPTTAEKLTYDLP